MQALIIPATEETPLVHLDKDNNIFVISGNSYPEDSTAFYKPVIQWITEFVKDPGPSVKFEFSFVYFNSSSYKAIYDILLLLSEMQITKGVELKVNWLYKEGDLDIREIGEGLAETLKFPFTVSAI